MARYDFQKLRKDIGITQKELADKLNISQGFLSSCENGKNLFPEDRVDDLQKLFPSVNLEDYEIKDDAFNSEIGSRNSFSQVEINDPDTLNMIFSFLKERDLEFRKSQDSYLEEIKTLRMRYDKLNERYDNAKDEIDRLKETIIELKQKNFELSSQLKKSVQ